MESVTLTSSVARYPLHVLEKKLAKTIKLIERARRLNLMGDEYRNLEKIKSKYERLVREARERGEVDEDNNKNNSYDKQPPQEDVKNAEVDNDAVADDVKTERPPSPQPPQLPPKDEEPTDKKANSKKKSSGENERKVVEKKLIKVIKMIRKTIAGSKEYKKCMKKKKEYEIFLGIFVPKIPKRSALLNMDTPESRAYKAEKAQRAKEAWSVFDKVDVCEQISSSSATPVPWKITKDTFDGKSTSDTLVEETTTVSCVEEGIQTFKENPEKYIAVYYSNPSAADGGANNDTEIDGIQMTYVLRSGTTSYNPIIKKRSKYVTDSDGANNKYTILQHKFELKSSSPSSSLEDNDETFDCDTVPVGWCDKYTDKMKFNGKKLHSSSKKKPLIPGRGQGLADTPNVRLIGNDEKNDPPTPDDIFQGSVVGNCWLLSAIASLADYEWAVKRLFRKTAKLNQRPFPLSNQNDINGCCNKYVVTLWDLKSWKEVDIIIDERLPIRPSPSSEPRLLLGAKPSKDGKLWAPYLEKAIAIHCGGYDKLVGGNCTNAWPLITGSRNQFTIQLNKTTNTYFCHARYNPMQGWTKHSNSPHDSDQSYWLCDWPSIGGGGDPKKGISGNELFYKIAAWDESNWLLGAATDGTSDSNTTDGIVDNHAYSIIDVREDVCGTGIDLLLLRNPWGHGDGLKHATFVYNGEGWTKYPQIKNELKPLLKDDGVFWLTKEEFFSYFPTIYVCAFNMTRLKDPNYVNDLDHDFPPPDKNAKVGQTHIIDPDELKPIYFDTKSDPSSLYEIVVDTYNGAMSRGECKQETIKGKSIKDGVEQFKRNPEKYYGIHFQTNIVEQGWPDHAHSYVVIYRKGTEVDKLKLKGVVEGGGGQRTFMRNVLK